MFQKTRNIAVKYGTPLALTMMTAGHALAQATGPEAAIATAETTILSIVGAAGAAFIAVALAGVGWSVGAKFIKRIGGKA